MKKIVLLTFILSSYFAFSQNSWQELMHTKEANFFVIQNDFNVYYNQHMVDSKKIPKGKGIKQFKRWEYYWQQRVDANGNFPKNGSVLEEIQKYRNTKGTHSNRATTPSGNWQIVGPVASPNNGTGQLNGSGRLNCIAFHPTDANVIYVGAPSGGFWKSIDNGTTWTEFSSGLTRLGVSSIAINPTNPNIIYIGTGDRDSGDAPGYGVWRSLDGGVSWSPQNTGMGNRTVYELLINPLDPNNLIATTNGSRIYRSTDGGANWTFASTSTAMKDIAFKPGDPNTIYASGTSFEVSTDNGLSFTQITSGVPTGTQRMALAVSENQPNWVYLLAGGGSGLVGIYRSTDSGTSFVATTTTPNILGYQTDGSDTGSQAWYDLVIVADPTDANVIYTGGVNLWKSTDGGSTMNCVSYWVGPSGLIDGVHADQHALEFSPHTNNLYNGNDGGIYYTTDGGVNWNDISSGLGIAQIYKIGVAQTIENTVINGYQDNGTSVNRGGIFTTEIGGDGMECIIDPTDANYMYGALYYGDIRRSANGGVTFSIISGSISETGAWVTPYKLDPNEPNRMFAGYDNIWRNDAVKTGTTWTQISSFGGTSNITDLAIAPSNSNIMYVARSASDRFYSTTNALAATPTWTDLTANLPVASTPKDIEIDPIDANHLFIALGNDIYESTNAGLNWTNISGTLPNISLNTIVIDSGSSVAAMYVGMDVGVYYKDNTLSDWVSYSSGLANLEITELEIYTNATECKSKLYAATYGQGLWVSDLKDPGTIAPTACFAAATTKGCTGTNFVFEDKSDFSPTSWSWTITPSTFIFSNGTSASSQNPEVIFTNAGLYTVELTVTNSNGSNTNTKISYIEIEAGVVATNFNEDFESEVLCSVASDCGTTVCSLTGFWNNLTNGTEDNIDWRVDEGGTPSANTGPTIDFNPGTAAGNYLYLEASGSCNDQIAILESQCMIVDQGYDFIFGYHMYGTNTGSLHIDLFSDGFWQEDIITSFSGDLGNIWNTATVNLNPYIGKTIKIRIRGIIGNGFASDIAVDDIQLVPKCGTTTTWNGVAWSNGTPTETNVVVLNGDYNTSVNSSFSCCTLEINSGFVLNIEDSNYVKVVNEIINNGTLNVKNKGSLIQVNDLDANVGTISYERIASIRLLDYVFWSSPIKDFNVDAISPLTPSDKIFKWEPLVVNPNGAQGLWVNTSSEIMPSGVGYIVRGPSDFTAVAQDFTAVFTNGAPNNGAIKVPISRGSYTGLDYTGTNGTVITRFDDNWNLIGNPYPSSINALDFLNLNSAKIEGAVRIWTHGTLPSAGNSDPYYGDYVSNYSVSDFIVHNGTGTVSGPSGFNGFIAGGQSFMVLMNDGPTLSDEIDFNNSLRSESYLNDQFYRYNTENEKSRIWLDLSNSDNQSDRTLIGFVTGATNDRDRLYDAFTKVEHNQQRIYSFVGNDKMTIQGFALPFSEEITIPIGVGIPTAGNYKIGIAAVDGMFTNTPVFLADLLLNTVTDITNQPYSFYAEANEINNRFVLQFNNTLLSNTDFIADFNEVVVENNPLRITSSRELIKEIEIYDVLGRKLFEKKNINALQVEGSSLIPTNNLILIKVKLNSNKTIVKKTLF
ncbi:MAG: hypothetical protein CMP76_08750 [Flavobacterium sp.]|uniref:VPS10 domain-containing protein n=1 Tax=Flavobacterium sp. TaxID=239 RepID=UPI000C51D5F5|nr:T9SS sorting signal type C domain-containing protein [Flavobacterium sp.]MBF03369.1 hypothetical protein [Flavobacterium sp.]|tara:strand:+ start:2203 stop:7002 length:4800 start_codon:yes stop_codon:yes gene_type:complete